MEKADKLKLVSNAVKTYPDFPKPGILFRDIFGIFKSVAATRAMRDLIISHIAFMNFDFVVGLDSRGFLLGPLLSFELAKPFVPIRKKGKLPGKVYQQNYTLEYGEDIFEMQADAVHRNNNKAIIVDDLLATGGSMSAAEKLLKSAGVKIVECLVIIELKSLKGRSKIEAPIHSLLQYD
ncbi:adenine phosphoribosyltransferase [Phymastichus coffea]|uniref:adenine phosphoribosyltransferase n=1 Tax=Phymastichus coffea TaxID=108790 RepID=UPI00273C8723|nr:adenine phosphoribosyltransferase [Phymastichus coffea]XP_058806594.1 adenine phosphoribosyltransferase [Phymastichus coffea]XP_058806595.1 adenine phosphoribosyltransferase [Phymastichus coffea]XP_058806596.1 adenine phosphoribosyltransferase [Phymastichus coffea]